MSTTPRTLAAGGRTSPVASALARRSLISITRLPSAFIPTLVFPIVATLSFAGTFRGVVNQYYPGMNPLNWYVPLNALQGAAFGGVFLGFAAIRDFQTGFYDRLLAAPAPRRALLAGPMQASVIRALFPVAIVLSIGFAGGMDLPGGFLGLVLLVVSCWAVCLIGTLYAHGLAFRFKSMSAAPLMQIGVFFLVFLSEAQVPIAGMTGWLEVVARLNPATYIMRMARAGFLGDVTWTVVWHGMLATVVLAVPTLVFAERGLRRLGR